jgi:hypothetical protein
MAHIFIISTSNKDRSGSVIDVHGWQLDNYRRNPVVQWMTPPLFGSNNPDEVIGTSRVWIENNKLYAEWYPDLSSEIAVKLVKKLANGTTFGASVSFLPIEGHYGEGSEGKGRSEETYYHQKQELLSWKICTLPANAFCLYQHQSTRRENNKLQLLHKKRMEFMMNALNAIR